MKCLKHFYISISIISLAFLFSACAADINADAGNGQSNAPEDVKAYPENGWVKITWAGVSDADSYNIYWSTTPGVTKTNGTKITGAGNPYSHSSAVENLKVYYYTVTAVINGEESDASLEVSAMPQPGVAGDYITQWGTRGNGNGQFWNQQGIAVDTAFNVYVADMQNNRVQKFDSMGNFITKWGTQGVGAGQFQYPTFIAVDKNGCVYVTESNTYRIQKFSTNGNFITQWDIGSVPSGIAVDSNCNVYVVELQYNRIEKFDSSGNFITRWGSSGDQNGQFYNPSGIAINGSGSVYVVDSYNKRIQVFDSNGNYLRKWGSEGLGNGQFQNPTSIALYDGCVHVVDTRDNHRTMIQKFDVTGNFISKWGTYGTNDGQLLGLSSIVIDSSGYMYLSDNYKSSIQKFR